MILSFKYRISPNKTQTAALSAMLADFCQLYNAALQHRIQAYEKGVSITCYDQTKTLPQIRKELPHIGRWSATAEQQVLRKLDKAYSVFFSRIKRGDKAGFPRFKSRSRYHAASFRVGDGLTVKKTGKIGFVGVPGEIKVRWHRELPNATNSAILTRQAGKWYVIFHVDVVPVDRASPDSIGIDVGLTSLAALSNGEIIERPNFTKQHAKALRRKQRALARCKRGSKRRAKVRAAVTKEHAKIADRRHDYLHKESRKLVNRFGRIAVENLNVKGLAGGMLAKEVNDAAWGKLTAFLRYKAEQAGCEVIAVDPRGTSMTCPECGTVDKKTLSERVHSCECGCVLDRDVAAAQMIYMRAFEQKHGTGFEALRYPVAGCLVSEAA